MQSRQHRQARSQARSLLSRLNNPGSDPGPRFEQCEPRQLLSSGFLFYDFDEIYPQADEVLADLRAPEDARRFGAAVADLGDIDGDGVSDFIVGAPGLTGEEGFGQFEGKAFVFSGRTFEVLYDFTDGYAGFGSALAGVGDVDGDGVPDIAIGSPRRGGVDLVGDERGYVYLHSGADGSLIYSLRGDAPGDRFGHELESLFDFDEDGAMEFAIGAPGAGANAEGQVFVISGDNGAIRDMLTGEAAGDLFGFAIGADPLSGNFIVGAPGADGVAGADAGKAYAVTGRFGRILWIVEGEAANSEFGYAVSFGRQSVSPPAGHVLIGAPGFGLDEFGLPTGPDRGRVYEYRGPFTSPGDGVLLSTVSGSSAGDRLGQSVLWLNSTEALIGAPGAGLGGRVLVHDFNTDDTGDLHATADPDAGLGAMVGVLTGLEDPAFEDVRYRALGAPDARDELGRPIGRLIISSRFVENRADLPVAISPDGAYAVALNSLLRTNDFSPSSIVIGPGFVGQYRNFIPADIDGTGRIVINDQLLIGDTFSPLTSLFTSIEGPDLNGAALVGVRLGEGGQVLVRRGTGDDTTAWVIEDGVLRHLWEGFLSDINASGVILGTRLATDGGPNITTLRLADGTFLDIPGLFNAGAINDAGMVAGMDAQGRLAVWHEGQIVPLGQIPGWGSPLPTAINDAGEIVGTYSEAGGGFGIFYYSAETGLVDLADVIVAGAPEGDDFGRVLVNELTQFGLVDGRSLTIVDLLDDGRIIGRTTAGNGRGFVLVPQTNGPFTSTATPIPAATSSGILIAGVNENGEPILFQQSALPSGWTAIDVASFVNAPLTDSNVITFIDPKDGLTYIATATEDGLILGRRGAAGGDNTWTFRNLNDELNVDERIITDIVHLQTRDNTINIAGLSADGELIMFFQTGDTGANGFNWQFTNLYDSHLDPQEVGRPRFAGDLIAYTTAWNALNFAGIDEHGDIQVVWWSPDLASGLWTANNLSEAAGTPRLAGGLGVYLTPWGGINLAAAAPTGEVVVTWWVPDFGPDWAVNNLTQETGGPTLIASSMTTFTSPWGALNIVGLDETGQVQTYWWVPPSLADGQDIWRVSNLTTEAAGAILTFDPAAGLRGLAQPGNLNVFGTTEDDEVIRLTWTSDDGWLFENLSTAALVA